MFIVRKRNRDPLEVRCLIYGVFFSFLMCCSAITGIFYYEKNFNFQIHIHVASFAVKLLGNALRKIKTVNSCDSKQKYVIDQFSVTMDSFT